MSLYHDYMCISWIHFKYAQYEVADLHKTLFHFLKLTPIPFFFTHIEAGVFGI